MTVIFSYNLLDLHWFLPIQNRDRTLLWLKSLYADALFASAIGYSKLVVIQLVSRPITAEELLGLINIQTGYVSPLLAQFFIELIQSNCFPAHLRDHSRSFDPAFLRYAHTTALNVEAAMDPQVSKALLELPDLMIGG